VEAAEVVRSNDSMTLATHTRGGRVEDVNINGGPLKGATAVCLGFFDDKLYQVIVVVDPKKISQGQLAKLAERKYGPSLSTKSTGQFKYLQKRDEFVVTVVENNGSIGICFVDVVMQKACEKYKLDEIGSL
tara:strand:- start:596 stop:988 length:393 start_codon:yes stop_codon:yes gene_type:complete